MSAGLACPRCGAATPAPGAGGEALCGSCGHRWKPARASGKRSAMYGSDEYMPDEPGSAANQVLALTQRVGNGSGVAPAIAAAGPPADGGLPPAPPAGGGARLDSGLFDRLEQEAQAARASLRTQPAIPAEGVATGTVCPVCGHRFPGAGDGDGDPKCPQCGTMFGERSGRFVVGSEPQESADPLIGRVISGCRIDRKLGEGGMGSVYHAKQLSLERSVAVKILPPDLARNRNFIQRFEREAKSLARINHPNILHIYDFGEDSQLGLYYMLIEFVDGVDLGEMLNQQGVLPQLQVVDLLRQALTGLEQAAEKGVIHRDIKPDNLMITKAQEVKVSDFGLAKAASTEIGVTAIGVRVGTPAFMSPEQCDGIDVDYRSDVYNLGCTAYLCLTGRLPFEGDTPFAIMLKHKTDPPPSVRDNADQEIDPGVDILVHRMIAKQPADRCSSLRELIEEVTALEGRLAGNSDLLRKSNGPMPALGGPRAARPASEPEVEEPRLPGQVPAWLKLVEDQPKAADDADPVPPAPAAAPPARGRSSPLPVAGGGARPPATPIPNSAPRSSSRRMEVDLDRARERARRSEIKAITATGDRLASGGRLDEAAGEWLRASSLSTDAQEQATLRLRAEAARQRAERRRLVRRIVYAGLFLILAVTVLYGIPPRLHNLLADRRLEALIEQGGDPDLQVRALRSFARDEGRPWGWYAGLFHASYAIAAHDRALGIASELERQMGPSGEATAAALRSGDPASLEAAAADPRLPWSAVAELADAQMRTGGGNRAAEIGRQAREAIAAARADAAGVEQAWRAGRHGEALRRAGEARLLHRRTPEVALPLPALLLVDTAGNPLRDLRVQVDGVPLALDDGPMRFCRWGDRPTTVEAAAPGFAPARLVIPASTDGLERSYTVPLRLAPRWSRTITTALSSPWGMRLHAMGGDLVGVQQREGLLLLRRADGSLAAQAERAPGEGGFTPFWQMRGSRLLAGLDDGQVLALDPGRLTVREVVLRGRQEVTAWIDFEMTFQTGRQLTVVVQEVAGAKQALALSEGRELWRYPNLAGNTPVHLDRADDRVALIDDTRIHLVDEDGRKAAFVPLPAPRIGPVVPCPVLGGLLVSTTTGLRLVRFGPRSAPVQMGELSSLSAPGPAMVAVDGAQILLAGLDASLELLTVAKGEPTRVWRQDGGRQQTWPPVLAGSWAATSEDAVTVRRRADGSLRLRVATGAAPAGPPLILGDLLVVCDRSGLVAAYDLAER